jgi:NAD dependent epimerase/dehydratase
MSRQAVCEGQGDVSYQGKRVFVTGACGFIGSHLVQRLVGEGARVRALVWYNAWGSWGWLEDLPADTRDAVEILTGDVQDARLVQDLCADQEVIFHLAALISIPYSYRAPAAFVETNVRGTLHVLEAARALKPACVVHTSTSEVYGTPQSLPIREDHPLRAQSPYAASKIAADKLAESYGCSFGVPIVTLRPFNTYGPRQSARAVVPTILTQLLAGRNPLRLGSLHPRRDLTFVSDTVEGFLRAGDCPDALGRVVQLGTGRSFSVQELVAHACEVVGRRVEVEVQSDRVRPEQSEVQELLADNTYAKQLLGWQPTVSLEDGLVATTEWFRTHLARYRADQYAV